MCLLHFSISFSFALHFPSVEMRSIDRTIGGETSSRGRHFALSFVMYFFIIHLLQPYRAALRLPGRSIDILPTAAAEPAELVVEHGVSMDHRTMTEREIFVMPQRWSCYIWSTRIGYGLQMEWDLAVGDEFQGLIYILAASLTYIFFSRCFWSFTSSSWNYSYSLVVEVVVVYVSGRNASCNLCCFSWFSLLILRTIDMWLVTTSLLYSFFLGINYLKD